MTDPEKIKDRENRAAQFFKELNELKKKLGVEISIEEVSDGPWHMKTEVNLEVFDLDEEFGGWNSYPAAHIQEAKWDLTEGVDWWEGK